MSARRQLARWAGWFALANAAVFCLIGLGFLAGWSSGGDMLAAVYTPLAFVGQFTLLALLPVLLIVLPLALVLPRRGLVLGVAVLLESAVLTLLVLDAQVFAEQRYHLTPLVATLFESSTWIFVGVIGLTSLVAQSLAAGILWQWVTAAPQRGGRLVAAGLTLVWLGGQGIHIWADAIGHAPVTQLTRLLPAYFPIHAKRDLARLGLVDPERVERQRLLQRAGGNAGGQLRYPLAPLDCTSPEVPPNIVIVLIDALRPDAITPALLPSLAAFRAAGSDFGNHWSGGNSSRAGIFSMFYGLPSTYVEAFYGVQAPPVLVNELRRARYAFGLRAAPGFGSPTDIGRTAFAGEPSLPGEREDLDAVARNRAVTDEWLVWLAQRDPQRPFFGFLYYDPPMGSMPAAGGAPLAGDERFRDNPEASAAWRQYRLAMQLIDGEFARVLAALEEQGVAGNTIVAALSDHGYEFDDNGLGYVGHASNFSAAQLRSTLLLRWPGKSPERYAHRSSHFDLPVTLLQDALGCRSDPADYALGRNLYAGIDWPWLIAGSYNAHAIVTPESVVVTHPGGYVETLGPDYRSLDGSRLDGDVIGEALGAMRRYYR